MKGEIVVSRNLIIARGLSMIVVVLMGAAAAGGLFLPLLYQDNPLVSASWRGNDWVTLIVAVPILVASMTMALRGSRRGRLVWMGMLAYALYNYAFYLFGAAFNGLFLAYTALFALSGFGLVFGLAGLDTEDVRGGFRDRTPVRILSVFMLAVAVFLGGFWIATSLAYLVNSQVPPMVTATSHPTNVTGALDLSMVVSINLLAAIWLWQRRPWGYVLAVIANVKGAVYMLALSAATYSAVRAGTTDAGGQIALWGTIGLGCLVASLALLANLRSARK